MCKDKKPSRRDFLKIFGASTALPLLQSPAQILIESILMGISQQAAAQVSGVTPRRFLSITFDGAPPRWTHDLMLTPYSTAGLVASGQVATRFEGGATATSTSYSTILRKGLYVPNIWQYSVPKTGGGTRPMDELLDSYLGLRGINIGNPDHGAAQALQFLPPGATQSLSALSADASSMPIASVNAGVGQYRFQSLKSKSPVTISGSGNMLSTLLTPFIRKDLGGFALKRQALASALDASVGLLNTYAESLHPGAKVPNTAMSDAKNLLSVGFGDLTTVWNTLLSKYNGLVLAALNPAQSLIGINDKPIPSDGTKKFATSSSQILSMPDLRLMITKTTNIDRMAAHFAMAEYVLTNNLSSSVSISPGGLYNLTMDASTTSYLGFDEHDTGTMVSLLGNTYYNLAYSACLLELIDQLKAKNIYQDTVILSGGEFGRNGRNDGSGSDHGYYGGATSIYSGALTGPLVLGNIYNSKGQGSEDTGTWGYGAPVAQLGKSLDLLYLTSTLAYLLRTPSPVTAASSLLTSSGTTLIPTIEKAKQV